MDLLAYMTRRKTFDAIIAERCSEVPPTIACILIFLDFAKVVDDVALSIILCNKYQRVLLSDT